MYKIWMLALSNIFKNKTASISLSLTIFVTGILLNLGLLTTLNFVKSFDIKADEVHSAHVTAVFPKQTYQTRQKDYIVHYPGVTETEMEDILLIWPAIFQFGTGEFTNPCVFLNTETKRNISVLSFIIGPEQESDRDIYVSYILHTGGGYDLGDDFVIRYKDKDYTFRIAGFTEDINLGSVNLGCIGFYLPKASYLRFQNELKDEKTSGFLLKARMSDSSQSRDLVTNFKKNEILLNPNAQTTMMWLSSYTDAKSTRTATADIGGAIIICFSLIILLISLLIIKFRVSTSIEDGMTDIGALKALGYTGRQIIASILLQFMILTFFSAVLGVITSYLAVGTLSAMFSAQTGILWEQGFDLKSSILSLFIILLSVFIITPLSAGRINKIHPITALRNGITTHSFKKNLCPLDRMKVGLNYMLAIKNMMINLKQNLMISVIIAAVSFACVFALVMYFNIVSNNKAFIDMIGTEMCSAAVTVNQGNDAVGLQSEITKMVGVRKAINYDYVTVTVNGESTQAAILDEFNLLENNQVYEGRFPKYDNEVNISGYMAKRYGKTVGDTLQVRMGDNTAEYLITGLVQNSSNIGMNISMTLEGFKHLKSDYMYNTVNVYLEKGKDVDSFLNNLREKYGDLIASTVNMKELANSQLGVYVSIVAIFATTILIVTALIVVMVLYLIIKALIIRRRRELGIQKAIGFTTFQLVLQISLSFLPIVLFGAAIGSLIGSISMNSMISVLFRGIGVMKVNFIIPFYWVILMCVGICLLAFVVSMLVSQRIRKITVYELIIE